MIEYSHSAEDITPAQLNGFFVGWPNPPTPDIHLRLLRNSDAVVLAVDTATGQVVGFITAITDGVLAAYIPFLEVLPAYQHRGIGQTWYGNRDYRNHNPAVRNPSKNRITVSMPL